MGTHSGFSASSCNKGGSEVGWRATCSLCPADCFPATSSSAAAAAYLTILFVYVTLYLHHT